MSGVIRFIQSVIIFAIGLALSGTLREATGVISRKAVKAHRRGGISFRWLNDRLLGEAINSKADPNATPASRRSIGSRNQSR